MGDDRELIRTRVNLVELIGTQVHLQRKGKNWTGLCPFHEDKNPSFSVNETLGAYRCWSCGAKGDVFTWVMATQKVDFPEAMAILAEKAGITLSKRSGESASRRGSLEGMMRTAQEFFVQNLSPEAIRYCDGRGLDANVRAEFGLGFAPEFDEALPAHLKREGFSLAEAKEIFLVEGDNHQGYRAKFRGRLMFPIRDERGVLVAFGGRLLGDGLPKYINSSDTPLYRKSRVLYGMDLAKDAISKSKRAILVEGYLDVIACHRAGLKEAVASLGTSVTDDHARLLKRWCDRVTILYDADAAGQKAAARATDILSAAGISVSVAMLPPGEDPDTLLRKAGPDAVMRVARGGLSPVEYRLLMLQSTRGFEEPEFWTEATALLVQATPLEVERFLIDLAPKYPGVRDPLAAAGALRAQVQEARNRLARPQDNRGPARNKRPRYAESAMTGAESAVLAAICDSNLRPGAWKAIQTPEIFPTARAYHAAKALLDSLGDTPPEGDVNDWILRIEPEDARDELLEFWLRDSSLPSPEYLNDAIRWLESRHARWEIHRAVQEGETGDDALREIQEKLRRHKT